LFGSGEIVVSRSVGALDGLVRLRAALILFVLGALCAGQALADCSTRHIYNHELVPFVLNMYGSGSCTIGNSPMQQSCVVPPDQAAEIHYGNDLFNDLSQALTSGLDAARGSGAQGPSPSAGGSFTPTPGRGVGVVSADNGAYFPERLYSVSTIRCFIFHPDDTGILVMNDPIGGDIIIDCRERCATTKIMRENMKRTQEQNALALQRQAASQERYQWDNLDITLQQQHCLPRGHNEEFVFAECHVVYDPRNGGVYISAALRHPFACKGKIENASGKLVCVDLKPQCQDDFPGFSHGDPTINISCRTQSTGVLADKTWNIEITKDCDAIWIDDPEKRETYPICTHLP
jgi:hypothetical protein